MPFRIRLRPILPQFIERASQRLRAQLSQRLMGVVTATHAGEMLTIVKDGVVVFFGRLGLSIFNAFYLAFGSDISEANSTENYGLLNDRSGGDKLPATDFNNIVDTLDSNLANLIIYSHGNGVYSGWELNGIGEAKQVSAGYGLVDGVFCKSTLAQNVIGTINGTTNYVYAQKTDSSPWSQAITFRAQISSEWPEGVTPLGSWVLDADGEITAVDNTLRTILGEERTVTMQFQVIPPGEQVTVGDGKYYIPIPAALNGYNLIRAQAIVITPGA